MGLALAMLVLAHGTLDGDGDGVPDAEDTCPELANPTQDNFDGDCLGDACDPDDDGDGVPNTLDNCPAFAATSANDSDSDGVGDACDNCPYFSNLTQSDDEETWAGGEPDGVGDACDPDPVTSGDRREALYPELAFAELPVPMFTRFRAFRLGRSDTLSSVAARFGLPSWQLAYDNQIPVGAAVSPGVMLRVRERRLPPARRAEALVLNVAERGYYLFSSGEVVLHGPMGVGRPRGDAGENWRTPVGRFVVTGKMEWPVWQVPPSIQAEMQRSGKRVLTEVPPGPGNPLGRYALVTSGRGPLIHETPYRDSVYGFTSHGCVRVLPEDMATLYARAYAGLPVAVDYETVKLMVTPEPRVFMEVHADVYARATDQGAVAMRLISAAGVTAEVDWLLVAGAVEARRGVPVDVSQSCRRPVHAMSHRDHAHVGAHGALVVHPVDMFDQKLDKTKSTEHTERRFAGLTVCVLRAR